MFGFGIARGRRITLGGSEEWIRTIENDFKPELGKMFEKLEHALEFYNIYCIACGFQPRLYTQSRKTLKPAVEIENAKEEKKRKRSLEPKKTKITRFGCQAKIRFCAIQNEKLKLIGLCSIQNREFQKILRTLTVYHKQTIVNSCKLNIGATKTFRIMKEQSNGYANIGDKDADMFINYFKKLAETQDGFYFAYEVVDCDRLSKVFWADGLAKINYSLFGDTITFDPTYGTKKVDNHKKSVTFAAALLAHENDESFKWVFEKFLDCMDQDLAIKKSVHVVFKQARHRYCMCHIMSKLTDKVDSQIFVWDNDCEPLEFEEKWSQVISDFQDKWIPAYFRDLPLGCLLKTTQRSEREKKFSQKRKGILCKHIIWILSGKGICSIPEQYILSRWTKKSHKRTLYGLDGKLLQDYDPTDLRKLEMSRVWSEFYATISVLNLVPENHMKDLSLMLEQFREKISPTKGNLSKEQKLEMLLGFSATSKYSGKRQISSKNKEIEKASKQKRPCNNCKQMGNHDKRNYPYSFPQQHAFEEEEEKDELKDESKLHEERRGL
ncbi:hypothetical protein RND81_01G091800 [Saponaria officinalis]|uniref:MULE transposase domain-containing protein n=1 Tax=Saponaria officinalis TaxID=3572 RepID=A0AAW1NDW6_SAPOF